MALEEILSGLEFAPNMTLDLGCGRGGTTYLLQRLFPGIRVISLDIVSSSLKYMIDSGINEDVICGSGMVLPIKNESMDMVVCDQVIEHVENEEELISEITRVLKLGGHMLVGSVMQQGLALSIYRGRNGKIALSPDHVREYASETEYIELFKNHVDVKKSYLVPIRFPLITTLVSILEMARVIKNGPLLKRRISDTNNLLTKIVLPRPGFYFIYVLGQKA